MRTSPRDPRLLVPDVGVGAMLAGRPAGHEELASDLGACGRLGRVLLAMAEETGPEGATRGALVCLLDGLDLAAGEPAATAAARDASREVALDALDRWQSRRTLPASGGREASAAGVSTRPAPPAGGACGRVAIACATERSLPAPGPPAAAGWLAVAGPVAAAVLLTLMLAVALLLQGVLGAAPSLVAPLGR